MPVFYVVHPRERHIQCWLDLFRALANPREKEQAHLTVQGPYKKRQPKGPETLKSVAGHSVTVTHADAFWGPAQNTVILRCEAERLRNLWYKPQYPDFNPHVTIYDGDSRELAEQVLSILADLEPFVFHCTKLKPLVTQRGQTSMSLLASIDSSLLQRVAGLPLTGFDLVRLSDEKRIDLLGSAVQHFARGQAAEQREIQPHEPAERWPRLGTNEI